MPRKPLLESDTLPYSITNRANRKEFFDVPLEVLWPIFVNQLDYIVREMDIRIYQFVLMNNHYHLLLSTPNFQLSDAMEYFQREVARQSNKLSGKINHLFGGKYKWCLITNENYYWNSTKYIYRNPVEAGLCNQVEQYPYSSLNFNDDKTPWKMVDHFYDPDTEIKIDLDWLNKKYDPETHNAIKAALRRKEFKTPKNRKGKHILLPNRMNL